LTRFKRKLPRVDLIGSHQVLAAEEEEEILALNLEAEASDVVKMMAKAVAVEGAGLEVKVATKADVVVGESDPEMRECRFLRPVVVVLHRLLRT
jgi:type IV secretory pathway protease TraF